MNSVFAALLSIPLFFAAPHGVNGPSLPPAPPRAERVAADGVGANHSVEWYFRGSLARRGDVAPDQGELARFERDELEAYRDYQASGAKADDAKFGEWFSTRLREFKVRDLAKARQLTAQQFLMERMVERTRDRVSAEHAPMFFYDWFKARTGSPKAAEWLASGTHQALYDLPVFLLWYSGFIRWFGALFAPLIEVPAGWFHTMSNRLWRRAASKGQEIANNSVPKFTPPDLEDAGVAIRVKPESKLRNWLRYVRFWSRLGYNQHSIGTHELRHGRDIMTQNLHWRENQFSQLISLYQAEANGFNNKLDLVKLLVMAYTPEANRVSVLNRTEELAALYEMQWRNRQDKFLEPEQIEDQLVSVRDGLVEDGVRQADIESLREATEGLARTHAKFPVAIVSQTIQDETYLEHGSEAELRAMQVKFRTEYGMREIYARYGAEAVRILREIGQEAEIEAGWDMIFLRLRSRDTLAALREKARTSEFMPKDLLLDDDEVTARLKGECEKDILPMAAE